jgi:hypothetical protein
VRRIKKPEDLYLRLFALAEPANFTVLEPDNKFLAASRQAQFRPVKSRKKSMPDSALHVKQDERTGLISGQSYIA